MHRPDERVGVGCVDPGRRRIRAHPTGVRPFVTVERAFEVLCRDERPRNASVADREERHLGPVEKLLDEDVRSGSRQRAHGLVDLVLRSADEDALPGGQAVRLDDTRWSRDGEPTRARHARRRHDLLRERLRPLDACRRRARAEDEESEAA